MRDGAHRLLDLRLLCFLHDELVQFRLVFCAEVLQGGGGFGGDAEVVHIGCGCGGVVEMRWLCV